MVTKTISLLEVVAMLLVLSGSGLVAWVLSLFLGDLRRLKMMGNFVPEGPRHRLAKKNVRSESLKLSSLLFFAVAIGVLMTIEPRDNDPYHIGSIITIGAILWSFTVMVIDTSLYLWDRAAILHLIEAEEKQKIEAPTTTTLVRNEDGQDILMVPIDVIEEVT